MGTKRIEWNNKEKEAFENRSKRTAREKTIEN